MGFHSTPQKQILGLNINIIRCKALELFWGPEIQKILKNFQGSANEIAELPLSIGRVLLAGVSFTQLKTGQHENELIHRVLFPHTSSVRTTINKFHQAVSTLTHARYQHQRSAPRWF